MSASAKKPKSIPIGKSFPARLYVIRKTVMAKSVEEAIKRERRIAVDGCWVDEKWLDESKDKAGNEIRGFQHGGGKRRK